MICTAISFMAGSFFFYMSLLNETYYLNDRDSIFFAGIDMSIIGALLFMICSAILGMAGLLQFLRD